MFGAIFRSWAAVLFAVLVFSAPPAFAQGMKSLIESVAGSAKKSDRPPEPSLAEQLVWARGELAASRLLLDENAAKSLQASLAAAGLPESRIEDFRSAVRDIQRTCQSAVDTLDGLEKLESEAGPVPQASVPKTEEEAADLRESLRRTQLAAKSARSEADLIARLLAQQQVLAANAEKEIRQLGEEESTARGDEARARAGIQLQLVRLQKRAADAAVFYGKWRIYQQDLLRKKADAQSVALHNALREGGFDSQINAARAASQLAAIARETADLEKRMASAVKLQASAGEAKKKFIAGGGVPSAPQAEARQAAADALADATQGLVATFQGSLALLDMEKSHWQAVKNLAHEQDPATARAAVAQAEEAIRTLTGWKPLLDRRLLEAREGLEAAQKNLRDAAADAALKDLFQRTVDVCQLRAAATGAVLSRAEQFISLQTEFLSEIERMRRGEGAPRKLARTWADLQAFGSSIWSFELFSSGINSITIGKVVLAVVGLLFALQLAGWISRWGSRAVVRNFRMAYAQQILLEKILFLPAAAIFVLTTLTWLNIPLTVFAFLGGALAIGLGFGAQNLVNNFISGLILLLERQIKVGDVIEVGPRLGKITHLGSRCSRLRTFEGVEVLIPNSSFLEKEVTNWTLADSHHRYDFPIGVAYGSPAEKVISVLEAALRVQSDILRDPVPGVFFESFGDSALIFRLYYWIEIGRETDPRLVGSQIRCRIDKDLREAGIELPFPQRDLHIRSSSPIPVRLQPAEE